MGHPQMLLLALLFSKLHVSALWAILRRSFHTLESHGVVTLLTVLQNLMLEYQITNAIHRDSMLNV